MCGKSGKHFPVQFFRTLKVYCRLEDTGHHKLMTIHSQSEFENQGQRTLGHNAVHGGNQRWSGSVYCQINIAEIGYGSDVKRHQNMRRINNY